MAEDFGRKLRHYRNQAHDPLTNKHLTQARFAELLSLKSGLRYSATDISRWETGRRQIKTNNRILLLGMVKTFYICGSITTLNDANKLLYEAGVRQLDPSEIIQIEPLWLKYFSPLPFLEASALDPKHTPAASESSQIIYFVAWVKQLLHSFTHRYGLLGYVLRSLAFLLILGSFISELDSILAYVSSRFDATRRAIYLLELIPDPYPICPIIASLILLRKASPQQSVLRFLFSAIISSLLIGYLSILLRWRVWGVIIGLWIVWALYNEQSPDNK